jgi:hypothetical protein
LNFVFFTDLVSELYGQRMYKKPRMGFNMRNVINIKRQKFRLRNYFNLFKKYVVSQ